MTKTFIGSRDGASQMRRDSSNMEERSKSYKSSGTPSGYHVDGYSSFINMWDKVYDMQAGKHSLKMFDRRIRAKTMVFVSDTQDLFLTSSESYRQHYGQMKEKGLSGFITGTNKEMMQTLNPAGSALLHKANSKMSMEHHHNGLQMKVKGDNDYSDDMISHQALHS